MNNRWARLIVFFLTLWAGPMLMLGAEDRQVVPIGLIYPLSGSMSSFGEDVAKALPLLEKRFNSEQSLYRFELKIDDGKFGQGNAAVSAAKKFISEDKVKFLVIGSSGEVLQAAPIAESAHVLVVGGFASHPAIRDAGEYIKTQKAGAEIFVNG